MPTKVHVLLRITSNDVIHSFWIPKLNGKRDAVPGRVHPLRMEADHPGIFQGQCTEFCGLSHARMRMDAVGLNADRLRDVGRRAVGARHQADRRARRCAARTRSAASARAATRSTG